MTTTAADETRLDTQATQAAPVTESPDASEAAELQRWLDAPAEETRDETVQNPDADETESEASEDDPELEAVVSARAERLAEEKAEQVRAEERQRQEQERTAANAEAQWRGIEESFRTRAPRIRGHLEAVQRGEAELNVDGILNEFNTHHAQIANVRDAEWHGWLYNETLKALPDAGRQRLEGLRQRGELPATKLLEELQTALSSKAKEGLHTEARLKEEHSKGALQLRRKLEAMLRDDPTGESVLGILRSRSQPAASRTARVPVQAARGIQALTDPSTPISVINDELAKAGV